MDEVSETSIGYQDVVLKRRNFLKGNVFALAEPKTIKHQITAHATGQGYSIKNNAHGILRLSSLCAPSCAIESSRLLVQRNRVKTENFHLCFSILSPYFAATAAVTSVVNDRPNTVVRSRINVWLSSE